MNKVFKRLLLLGPIAAIAFAACAQELPANELSKVKKPAILERAKQGVSQELVVSVDMSAIDKEFDTKRATIHGKEIQREASSSPAEKIGLNNEIAYNNEAIIKDHTDKLLSQKNSVFAPLASLGIKVVRDYPHSSTSLVTVPDFNALQALLKNPLVIWISADEVVKISATWPGSYQDMTIIAVNAAQAQGYTGSDTMVAILDTGFDQSLIPPVQPGSQARLLNISDSGLGAGVGPACSNGPRPVGQYLGCPNGNWQHGTLDAQIIAKVAPGTYLDYEEVVDNGGASNSDYVRGGLDNVIAMKQSEATRQARGYWPTLVAVNLSLALDPTSHYSTACPGIPIADELNKLIGLGVVVVVAAGNDGSTAGVNSPACFPGVVSVGATYDSPSSYAACHQTQSADKVACFSNRSAAYPTVYAPGVQIGGPDVYVNNAPQSGTSFAAPHVSGEIAVLRQTAIGKTRTVPDLITAVKNGGVAVDDGTGVLKNRIDISKALATLQPAVTSLTVTPQTATVFAGGYIGLVPNAYDQAGRPIAPGPRTWTSFSPNVATVDATGKVTALTTGTAQITVRVGSLSAAAMITVKPAASPVIDVPLNPLSVGSGETLTLRMVDNVTGQSVPYDTNDVYWNASNPPVLMVSDGTTAEVTAFTEGTTVVTAGVNGLYTQFTLVAGSAPPPVGTNPPNCSKNPHACAVATPKPLTKKK